MIRDEPIGITMRNKKWRSAPRDVGHGIGHGYLLFVALDGTAYQPGFWRPRGIVAHAVRQLVGIHLQKVRRAKPVCHGMNTTGEFQIFSDIEDFRLARCAEKGDQMSSCRRAPRAKTVRIKPVLLRIAAQPAHCRFTILNLRRKIASWLNR